MYLGIDIGGTFVKYGFIDNDGNVSEKGKIPTLVEKEEILDSLKGLYLKFNYSTKNSPSSNNQEIELYNDRKLSD